MKFILTIVLGLALLKLSTYGWRATPVYSAQLSSSQQASMASLKGWIHHLSARIGNRNSADYDALNQAADFIADEFAKMGYSPQGMNYTLGGRVFRNIIVDKPGQSSPEETIIMGAHYDTCFNPGADDNASGVAGVLELARLLKGEVLKRNVKFIAFTNEEPPFFLTDAMGSRVYAQAAKRDNEKIKAAVILEMIGYYSEGRNSQRYLTLLGPFYPHRGNFLAVIGNFPSRHLVAKMGKYFKQASSFPVESLIAPSCLSGVYFSDHWSFWKEGYPAVMITDTAFLRNPHYHHDSDLPETLDYEKMSLAVHGLKEAIVRMANE